MMYRVYWKVILILAMLFCVAFATEEFCNSEIFQPRCSTNEIILIQEAIFGRRSMGRCLLEEGKPSGLYLEDPKFIGCYENVKSFLEPLCAGKSNCEVIVSKIKANTSCHNWLKLHLEVAYICLQIVPESRHCTINLNSGRQHVASPKIHEAPETSGTCGSKSHPWSVETLSGQKITTGVLQLSGTSDSSRNDQLYFEISDDFLARKIKCNQIGFIVEKSNRKTVRLCSGGDILQREKTPSYISSSNNVEITFEKLGINKSGTFILALEASGCSDLIPPADAWLKRTENEAIIGCYSTRLRWQLKCQEERWVGVIGNCSNGWKIEKFEISLEKQIKPSEDQVIPIVAVAMTGFVVCFLIICLGIVFINRYYALSKSRAMRLTVGTYQTTNQPSIYNNGSHIGFNPNKSASDKDPSYLHENNGTLLPDTAQYFELDQALVNKEDLAG